MLDSNDFGMFIRNAFIQAKQSEEDRELDASSKSLFNFYKSFVRAGFTKEEAMMLICSIIQGTVAGLTRDD